MEMLCIKGGSFMKNFKERNALNPNFHSEIIEEREVLIKA
jgi:hypothetical protein